MKRSQPSSFRKARVALFIATTSVASVTRQALAVDAWWKGTTSNLWTVAANWSTTNTGATPLSTAPSLSNPYYIKFSATGATNFTNNVNLGSSVLPIDGLDANAGQPQIVITGALDVGSFGINKYGDQYFDLMSAITSSTGTLTMNQEHPGGITRFYGGITNSGATPVNFVKIGTGEVQLIAASSYTGLTSVQAGTLRLWGATTNNIVSGDITVDSGATLASMDHNQIADSSNITINGGWSMNANAGAAKEETFRTLSGSGTINGGGIVLKPVGGTSTFAGTLSNLYFNIGDLSTGTQILTGNSSVGVSADFNAGTLQIGNGGTGGAFAGFIRVRTGAALNFNRSGTLTHANQIDGAGNVYKNGPGTVIFSTSNTYTGSTTINQGTLQLNSNTSANGAITINSGGVLALNTQDIWGNAFCNQHPTITVNAGGTLQSSSFSTVIDLKLNGGNVQLDAGLNAFFPSLALKGTVSVTGSQAVQVAVGAGSFAGINVGTNVAGGTTTFSVADTTGDTNPDFTIAAPMQNNRDTGGNVVASGIAKTGAGTLRLTSINSYSGGTTVSGGTLQLGAGTTTGAISSSGNIINNANVTFNRSNTLTQGTDFGTFAAGTGSVTQAGTGTVILNTINSFTGGTAISGGTLQIGAGGTTGEIAPASSISNSSYLVFNRTNAITQGAEFGAITGSGTIVQAGTGTLVLTANNVFSGRLNVTGGTLSVGNGSNAGALVSDINLTNSSAVLFNRTGPGDSSTYPGKITGTGSVFKLNTSTLTLTGSSNFSGSLQCVGRLNIDPGATIVLAIGTIGVAGSPPGMFGAGTITVNGGTFSTGTGSLVLGSGANAGLVVQNNGKVFSGDAVIGSTSSNSLADIDGGTWTSSGRILLAATGSTSGELRIQNGGLVSASSVDLGQSNVGVATVSVSNGTLQTSALNVGGGSSISRVFVNSGSRVITGNSYIGVGGSGVASVSAGTWTSTNDLRIGSSSPGTLTIQSAGTVSSGSCYIGFNSSVNGTLTISGGTLNNSGSFVVGNSGTGRLSLQTAGSVSTFNGIVGNNPGSSGTATISDGTWSNAGGLYIGLSGTGQINQSGGIVTSASGYIASSTGGVGTATVSGGTWTNSGLLKVGNHGSGTLIITTGGSVVSKGGELGAFGDGTGFASVNAGTWTVNTDGLTVGNFGPGRLDIQAGGSAISASCRIGYSGDGTVTVGGTGAVWTNSGNLELSPVDLGAARLFVNTGGQVAVGGITSVGSNGSIIMGGGRLDFGTMTFADYSQISGNGGTLTGNVDSLTGFTDAGTLSLPSLPGVNTTNVYLSNSGVLYGNAILPVGVNNTTLGEIETGGTERLRFLGSGTNNGAIRVFGGQVRFGGNVTNAGQISIFGGQFVSVGGTTNSGQIENTGAQFITTGAVINTATGVISGRGQFIADSGWTNQGSMNFSGGFTDVRGNVTNTGTIITAGNGVTTFYNNLVHNGAEVRTLPGSLTVIFGTASGTGTWDGGGTFQFEGGLSPGNSPGLATFDGDVLFGAASKITLEIAGYNRGSQYDAIDISGNAALNGSIDVRLLNGFVPVPGDQFDVMTFGSMTGNPTILSNDGIPAMWFTTVRTDQSLMLVAAALPGDATLDGTVNTIDFNILAGNFGQSGMNWYGGDFTRNGIVDSADFNALASGYGQHVTSSAALGAVVPEPYLAPLALSLLAFRRRRIGNGESC